MVRGRPPRPARRDKADDHLGPIASWDVCGGRLLLGGKRGPVRDGRVWDVRFAQEVMNRGDAGHRDSFQVFTRNRDTTHCVLRRLTGGCVLIPALSIQCRKIGRVIGSSQIPASWLVPDPSEMVAFSTSHARKRMSRRYSRSSPAPSALASGLLWGRSYTRRRCCPEPEKRISIVPPISRAFLGVTVGRRW